MEDKNKQIRKQKIYIIALIIVLSLCFFALIVSTIAFDQRCLLYNDLVEVTNKGTDLISYYSDTDFQKISYACCPLDTFREIFGKEETNN